MLYTGTLATGTSQNLEDEGEPQLRLFDTYPGGVMYVAFGKTNPCDPSSTQDTTFRLSGDVVTPAAVPEPASLVLLGTGLVAMIRRRRGQRDG
jgi:hypothetical protein